MDTSQTAYHQTVVSPLWTDKHKDMTNVDANTLYGKVRLGYEPPVITDDQGRVVNRGAHEGHFKRAADRILLGHSRRAGIPLEELPLQPNAELSPPTPKSFSESIRDRFRQRETITA
jgi:hypothetical protein